MKQITKKQLLEILRKSNNLDNEIDNERDFYFNDNFANNYALEHQSDFNGQDHYTNLN